VVGHRSLPNRPTLHTGVFMKTSSVRRLLAAASSTIIIGVTLGVPAHAEGTGTISGSPPMGTIEGSFVDRSGQGLNNFSVDLSPVDPDGTFVSKPLSDGRFSVAVFASRYRVSFRASGPSGGTFIQYAGGTDILNDATVFDVVDGSTVTIHETKLPTGTMSGRFTDSAGNGLAGVEVSLSRPDLEFASLTYTDTNGYYLFPLVRVGSSWKVLFTAYQLGLRQYAFGKVRESEADLVTITENRITQVSD
jgi:hypothetical protein